MFKLGGRYTKGGKYWSAVDGSIHDMKDGGVLPGKRSDLFIRRPPGGAFVVVPIVALLYAVTFPALGPLAVAIAWTVAIAGIAAIAVSIFARTAHEVTLMGWRPVAAFFAGRKRNKKK